MGDGRREMGGGREGGGRWVMKLLLQKMLTILGVGGEGGLIVSVSFLAPLCCFSLCFWIVIFAVVLGYTALRHSQYCRGRPAYDDLGSREGAARRIAKGIILIEVLQAQSAGSQR